MKSSLVTSTNTKQIMHLYPALSIDPILCSNTTHFICESSKYHQHFENSLMSLENTISSTYHNILKKPTKPKL